MRPALLFCAALCAFSFAGSALAQSESGGDPVPEVGQDVERGEAPVIIDRTRGPERGRERETILPEHQARVQIQGAWAENEAACATATEDGDGGIYLTDTLIRWQEATCSIRNIDAENGSATIHAFCTEGGDRRERTFQAEMSGEEALSLRFQSGAEQQEVSLSRCPAAQ